MESSFQLRGNHKLPVKILKKIPKEIKIFFSSYTIVQDYSTFWTSEQSQFVLILPPVAESPETTDEPTETTENPPNTE